jgi:cyclopropane-fatty-acyl-phospholipid synthase
VIELGSPAALRRLLWAPGELGLAQAYVTGELDVDGDLAEGLRRVWASAAPGHRPELGVRGYARAFAAALRLGALGTRPQPPRSQARLTGRVHSRSRDRAVISHHYDLSNEFYALILDPSMAYSCGYWGPDVADALGTPVTQEALAEAQRAKFDLICRKLELRPGMRLLDVGCGWGGLLMHAAEHYGVTGHGLTLSKEQAASIRERLAGTPYAGRIDVELRHFRDLPDSDAVKAGSFDAISTIEMGEHVGHEAYPVFTRVLRDALRPGGRLLVQQMSRAEDAAAGGGPFIEAFIAPDMHMRPLRQTVGLWQQAGFELLDTEPLGPHYVRTVQAWEANLEERWDEAVALVGLETARVWRLYLAGGALAFEQGRMGVDQILARRPEPESGSAADSGMAGADRAGAMRGEVRGG